MNFIKNNKLLITLLVIAIIFFMAIVIIILKNISLGSENEYGNRLDNIDKYPITEEMIITIKNEIGNFEKVESLNYNLEGRLANFIMKVDSSLSIEDARNYGNRIIERLNEDIKNYYDIQVLIDVSSESEQYPIIGYKHKTSKTLIWEQ